MHVRVRVFGKPDTIVVVESKLTKIEQFRRIIQDKFQVDLKLQRLLYGGKLLENGYTFHDYNIKLNDVIQLMVKLEPERSPENIKKQPEKGNEKKYKKINYQDGKSSLYEVGDLVDVRDKEQGAWFEATIVKIVCDPDAVQSTSNSINHDKDAKEKQFECSKDSDTENIPPEAEEKKDSPKSKKKGIAKYFTKASKNTQIEQETLQQSNNQNKNLLFKVHFDGEEEASDTYCKLKDIRPRARCVIDIKDLQVGQKVMVNHNIEQPLEKGYWYDFTVNEIKKLRTSFELIGTLYLGAEAIPQNDTVVKVHDKLFAIEEVVPLGQRTEEQKKMMITAPAEKRSAPLNCLTCRDDEEAPCKDCGCFLCLGKENPEKIVLCDECNNGYHMQCLSPPLEALPDEDWYCPSCKRDTNDVIAPGAAKQTKKTSASKSNRDWGRGMACAGKTKTCAMPPNHFGPIPGIEVGMCWRYRIQLSESGVHRPPVSGIHGRDVEGAYSIVLSGGYEDDVDHGYEFTYTGSGGRDLSGNKRTAEQSCDQTLTRENKALARNCAVKVISESGADAGENWRDGKPVRVVRSYKMLKHFPKYAPKEGIRYDGIYKVVKYYPEKGLSGFRVWKYLLRRDDPSPAPWEPGAKQYSTIFPDGFLEAEAEKKALKEKTGKTGKGGKKRSLREGNQSVESDSDSARPAKKRKIANDETEPKKKGRPSRNKSATETPKTVEIPEMFSPKTPKKTKQVQESSLSEKEIEVIKTDTLNAKLWDECMAICKSKGKKEFVEHITQVFLCIICQDVIVKPVTTPCLHNFCMACLKLAFKSMAVQCPYCRQNLSKYDPELNEHLQAALRTILAGYDAGKK